MLTVIKRPSGNIVENPNKRLLIIRQFLKLITIFNAIETIAILSMNSLFDYSILNISNYLTPFSSRQIILYTFNLIECLSKLSDTM